MEDFVSWVMGAAAYIIPFIIVLSVVVFVHEFGHFWVARRVGVRVETFSIGFGGEIFGWHDKWGTRWKVSWLPLGGYVKMFGDTDASSMQADEKVMSLTEEEKKEAFFFQPLHKRMAVVAAGPLSNYVFAILVLTGLFVFNGQPYTAPLVGEVIEASAAARAGLQKGDVVLSIDGVKVDSFEEIKRIIALNVGESAQIMIDRAGEEKTIEAIPDVVQTKDRLGGEHKLGRLGIASTTLAYRDLSFFAAVREAFVESWNLTYSTLRGVGQMILGTRGTEELGGPIRIAEMSGKMANEGVLALIWFMAVLSVNLGLINLFPIPLLDGGHLLFYTVEGVRGRPLGEKAQDVGANIGLLFVVSLMIFSTWNDLVHLRVVSFVQGLFS